MDSLRAPDLDSLRALDVVVHFFDTYASRYEEWAGGLHRRVAARLVELAAPRPAEICLDVGCGTGLVANAVARLVGSKGQVIGLDVSAGMLEMARAEAPPNVLYQKISADPHLWFRDRTFDLVTFGDSLSYLSDPFSSLQEARRVLRPGGRVAVAVHRRSMDTTAQEVFFGMLDELVQVHPFDLPRPRDQRSLVGEPQVLTELMLEAGFARPTTTMMVTGARMPDAAAWLELMAGAGPRPYALLTSLGPATRQRLLETLQREMERLGEEAFHYHVAFTFAVAATDEPAPATK